MLVRSVNEHTNCHPFVTFVLREVAQVHEGFEAFEVIESVDATFFKKWSSHPQFLVGNR